MGNWGDIPKQEACFLSPGVGAEYAGKAIKALGILCVNNWESGMLKPTPTRVLASRAHATIEGSLEEGEQGEKCLSNVNLALSI